MEELIKTINLYSDEDMNNYVNSEELKSLHSLKLFCDNIYYNEDTKKSDTYLNDNLYDILKTTIAIRDKDYTPPIGVSVNIKEIKKPELNAYLIAENIATQLIKRIAFRRAMKRGMQSASRLGALGIKVMVSGRLNGTEIARTEWERDGSIPSHTLRANIDYGTAEALTTYGIIGIKVWVYKGQLYKKDVENEKKERVKNATTSKN